MTADVVPAVTLSPTLAYVKPAVSEIRYGRMRFLITDRPSVFTLATFIKELRRNRVSVVVRVCEPTYPAERLERHGIRVIDWEYTDGAPPSTEIIDKWLQLVRQHFQPITEKGRKESRSSATFKTIRHEHRKTPILAKTSTPSYANKSIDEEAIAAAAAPPDEYDNRSDGDARWCDAIAVHCVAGLGRAPLLVAIALLEAGMTCDDVVFLIRTNRRGALNDAQLKFLHDYKSSGRLRKLRYASTSSITADAKIRKSCGIM